jgi:hypothetical protein
MKKRKNLGRLYLPFIWNYLSIMIAKEISIDVLIPTYIGKNMAGYNLFDLFL